MCPIRHHFTAVWAQGYKRLSEKCAVPKMPLLRLQSSVLLRCCLASVYKHLQKICVIMVSVLFSLFFHWYVANDIRPITIHTRARYLSGANPYSELMLDFLKHFDSEENKNFHEISNTTTAILQTRKCGRGCCLEKGGSLVSALLC